MLLHFHKSFEDVNARYNINQNIDSTHDDGSAVYTVFTCICRCSKHKREFDPNVLHLH